MAGFLDLATWKRREHFAIYSALSNPFWSLCAEVDVTRLWEISRKPGSCSFSPATMYLALAAANDVEAFRLRIRDGKVWVHDEVGMSTTVLRPDETFAFAIFCPAPDLSTFEDASRKEIEIARQSQMLHRPAEGRDDLIYHSTIPWIRFTAFSNAIGRPGDCMPRVVFGRVSEESGRYKMPVAVEVHHALVDGLDVARFLEGFQKRLDAFTP